MIRIRYLLTIIIFALLACFSPLTAYADTSTPGLLITEFSPGFADASKEFVEVYNNGSTDVDLANYTLYKLTTIDATSKTTFAKPTDSVVLRANTFAVFASDSMQLSGAYPTYNHKTKLLSSSGGVLQLADSSGSIEHTVDQVAWGSAASAQQINACTIEASQTNFTTEKSYKRMQDQADGHYLAADQLCLGTYPTPGQDDGVWVNDIVVADSPAEDQSSEDQSQGSSDSSGGDTQSGDSADDPTPVTYLSLQLSELLPDPVAPQTDQSDEFIEIYNPNDQAVNLEGYQLQAGGTWQSHYVFSDQQLAAHGYLAVTSAESPISLANSGGQVRLLDPADTVLDSVQYPSAPPGRAYMRDASGNWVWTIKPTPSEPNELVTNPIAVLAAKTKAAITKKASAPKATTSKSTAKKAAAPKKTTAKKASTAPKTATSIADAIKPPSMVVLGGVGTLVAGYGIYEYRQDLLGFLRRFWRKQ